MNDIVIFAGSALGSVLAIATNVNKEFNTNCYVVCLNSKFSGVFNASKYITESLNISGNTESELFEIFQSWVANKTFTIKPIIYFTTDTSCLFVDKYRQWFEDHFILTIPSSHILKTYNFKGLAEIDAKANDLTIPKTKLIRKIEDVNYISSTFQFPVILKPTSGKTKKSIGFKVKIFQELDLFQKIARQLIGNGNELLCQEYIPGNDNKVHYYIFYRDEKGMIWDTMGIKLLQSPPNGGIMAKGISKFNKDIAQISQKFLNKIAYTGIGGIEYKEYNGQYYFIEMSTRPEGFFLISQKAGVPISSIAYNSLSGGTIANYMQKEGVKYIDLLSTLSARRSSKKYLSLLLDYFDALLNPNTYINILNLRDLRPFLIFIKMILK